MIYARMYATEQQALDAVGKLREEGFPTDTILTLVPGGEGEKALADIVRTGIKAGFIPESEGRIYARCMELGRSLVFIRVAFGYGLIATEILDSCDPVDTHHLPEPGAAFSSAPLSAAMGWPVIKADQAAPLSSLFGLPALKSSSAFSFASGSLLSDQATPLSSMFGLKTLISQSQSSDSSFGMPLLSRNPAPFSSLLGLPLLSNP